MKTIALRFADFIAPEEGTIQAHDNLIVSKGYVWYGKIGSAIADSAVEMVLDNEAPRILLIHSGTQKRYWAFVDTISRDYPGSGEYPSYYEDKADKVKSWIRVTKFEPASNDILSKCTVMSSGQPLSNVSRHSMSPYYKIEVPDDALDN